MTKKKLNSLQNNKKFSFWAFVVFFIHYHFASKKQETYMLNDNKLTVYFHIKLDFRKEQVVVK